LFGALADLTGLGPSFAFAPYYIQKLGEVPKPNYPTVDESLSTVDLTTGDIFNFPNIRDLFLCVVRVDDIFLKPLLVPPVI